MDRITIKSKSNAHVEYEIMPYSGSSREPYGKILGKFRAKVIMRLYDSNDYNII